MDALTNVLGFEALLGAGVAALAGLVRGFAGVGSGMLMAPVFAILFGPLHTVGIIVLIETVVTVQLLPGVYRDIEWPVIALMGGVAALFMPIGSWLLMSVAADTMTRVIAAIVVVFALLLASGWRYRGPKRAPVTVAVGALSGTMMAATSLGNPPVMIYLLSSQDQAARNRANFTGYFAVTLLILLLWMSVRGLIGVTPLTHAALFVPGFMLSAWIGARLFRRSGEALYRRVTIGLLLCVGLFALLR